jgi:pimeloyl-ACP methyl ester carboxylesterase
MAELTINGCSIHYDEFGSGSVPVVLTPGGRWGAYVMHLIAEELAKDFRVIVWDRRNTDARSSIVIGGDQSEADIWANDLAALIQALQLGPCYLGEYAGCRTTPLLALKHPGLVKGLMLGWISGGDYPAERLPKNFYRGYISAALRHGMKGVIETSHFADSIKLNPANRDALLAMPPIAFIRQMAYWEAFFTTSGDLPVAGCRASDAEWRTITAPASVTGGVDPVHPTAAAERLRSLLPNCVYHDPVVTEDEWNAVFGVEPYPVTSKLQGKRLAPVWRDFIKQQES